MVDRGTGQQQPTHWASTAKTAAAAPTTLTDLHLIERLTIRHGAEVWLARRTSVAGESPLLIVKMLRPPQGASPVALDALWRRLQVASSFMHRGIAQVLRVGRVDASVYVVRQLVPGFTAAEVLRAEAARGQRLPPWFAMSLLRAVGRTLVETLEALRQANAGWIRPHALLELDNIIINTDGDAMLLEFWLPPADDLVSAGSQGDAPCMPPHARTSGDAIQWDACARLAMTDLMVELLATQGSGQPATGRVQALPAGLLRWIEPCLGDQGTSAGTSLKRLVDSLEEAALVLDWSASPRPIIDHLSLLFGRGYEAAPANEDFTPAPETLPYPGAISDDFHRDSSREMLAKLVADTAEYPRVCGGDERTMPGVQFEGEVLHDRAGSAPSVAVVEKTRHPSDAPRPPPEAVECNTWQLEGMEDSARCPDTMRSLAAARSGGGVSEAPAPMLPASAPGPLGSERPPQAFSAGETAAWSGGSVWSLRNGAGTTGPEPGSYEPDSAGPASPPLPLAAWDRPFGSSPEPSGQAANSDRDPVPPDSAADASAQLAASMSPARSTRHVWDRIVARLADQKRSPEEPSATTTGVQSPGAKTEGSASAWDRAINRLRATPPRDHPAAATPAPDSRTPAQVCFDEGLALVREGQHERALVEWQRATELEPENRLYQSNLRILRRRLGLAE